jgi:hypothetical protein
VKSPSSTEGDNCKVYWVVSTLYRYDSEGALHCGIRHGEHAFSSLVEGHIERLRDPL